MKNKIIDFIENLLRIFGVIVLIFTVSVSVVGDEAENFSNLFGLGNEGISVKTIIQFFAFSFLICLFRLIFLTDLVFKNAGLILRYVLFFVCTIASFIIFAVIFNWIPDRPGYWLLVLICFSVSTLISILLTWLFTRKKDEKLNDALMKIQKRC